MSTSEASVKGLANRQSRFTASMWLKPVVFLICLIPLGLVAAGVAGNKFVDPIEVLLHTTGEWGLRFLLITLCITPAQIIFKSPLIAKYRRMLGLFTFFYTSVHLGVWVALDLGLNLSEVVSTIIEKKFITLGMIAWFGMLLLALTSNRFAVRKLGRRWKKLHNWIYLLAVMAVVHFVWQVKASEVVEPLMYVGSLVVLLLWRFARVLKNSGS